MTKTPVAEIRRDPDIKKTGLDIICAIRAPSDVVSLSPSFTLSASGSKNQSFWHLAAVRKVKVAERIHEIGHDFCKMSTFFVRPPKCGQ